MSRFIITAILQLQAPKNLSSIVNQINRQLSGIQANIDVKINQKGINQFINNMGKARTTVNNFTSDIERAGYMAGRTLRRYAGFTAATGAFIALGRAISSGVKEALDYETTFNKIRQVTGTATRDLSGLNKEIVDLSTNLGVSSNKIAQSALTLAQAGLSAEKTKAALTALAKTELSATFDDIVDTTEGAIAIFQQFAVEAEDLEKVLGSINTVSAKFAVESSDIVTAVRRTGGAFAAAGGNINELIALFTSVRQTTRESAESIATGFRTIFTRLQRVRTQDFLKTLGIDLRDIEGRFVGPYEAVKRLSEALKSLESTDPRFAQVVEELGGFRQVSKVIPLIQKFDISQRALNIAQRSGNSISEDAAKAQDTLANKISKVREEFSALLRKVASSNTFQALVEVALKLSSAFIKIADSLSPLLPLITTFATQKLGSGISEFIGRQPGKGFRGGILGFATGGMVPGSGNSDSVPAMLTPGEFVIRKNAVKAIGAKKLAGMNRYAEGGQQKELTEKDKLIQEFINKGITENRARATANSVIKRGLFGPALDKVLNEQLDASKKEQAGTRKDAVVANTNGSPVIAGLFANPIPGTDKIQNTFAYVSTLASKQQQFGDILKALGDKGIDISKDSKSQLKIPFGAEFVTSDNKNKVTTDFIDSYSQLVSNTASSILAGSSFSKNNIPASQLGSIGGYFFENVISALTGQFQDDDGQNFDFFPAQNANGYQALFGKEFGKYKLADAKYALNNDSKASIKDKTLTALTNRQLSKNDIQVFANGGSPKGTDTVPAMLTPGEFIVNKKAASRIGKSNLERLNQADKVRKYATGGAVGNIRDAIGANPLQSLGFLSIITQFAANMDKTNGILNGFANAITGISTQFIVLSTLLSQSKNSGIIQSINEKLGFLNNPEEQKLKIEKLKDQALKYAPNSAPRKFLQNKAANLYKEDFRKRQSFNRAGMLGIAAGTIGGFFGNELQSSQMNQIRSGQGGNATLAGVGGALSTGGQGAAIGSIFGPFGAAIGAVTGGIYGFYTSLTEASLAIEKADFDKKFTSFSKALDRVASGKTTAISQGSTIRSGVSNIQSRLLRATGSDRETLKGQIDNSVTQIEVFLNKLAESSTSFNEFNRVAGNAIPFFAQQTSQSAEEVRKSFEKLIVANQKNLQINQQLIALRVKEFQDLRSILTITNSFNSAADSADKLFDSISSLSSVIDGNLSSLKFTSNSFAGGDVSKISSQSKVIDSLIGGGQSNKVTQIAQLQQQLPDILLGLRNKAPLEGEGFVNTLLDQLKGFDQDIIQGIKAVAEQKLVGREGKDVEAINELFKDLNGTSKDLLRSFEPLVEVYDKAQQQLNEFFKKYESALDQSIKLIQKEKDSRIKLINIDEQIANVRAGLSGNPLTLQQNLGFENERTRQITGGLNPQQLKDVITQAQQNIDNARAGLDTAENPRDIKGFIDAIKANENTILNVNNALDYLANVSERAAPYLKELENLKGLREFQQNLGRTLAVGTLQDRRTSARGLAGASTALKNGTFNGLPPSVAGQAFDTLQELGKFDPRILEKFQNIFSNTLQSRGVNKVDADRIAKNAATPQEQRVAQALEPIFKQSQDAQNLLVSNIAKTNEIYNGLLKQTFDKFIADLNKRGEEERKIVKDKQLGELNTRQSALNAKMDARNRVLRGIGGNTDSDIKNAELALPDAKRRLELLDQKRKLDISSGIGSKSITKEILGDGLLNKEQLRKDIESGKIQKILEERFGDANKASSIVGRIQSSVSDSNFGHFYVNKIIQEELQRSSNEVSTELGKLSESTKTLPDNVRNSVLALQELGGLLKIISGITLPKIQSEQTAINTETKIIGENFGGPIPGIGNTDTVPAMLTPGEFVMKKSAVQAIGLNNLYAMNATGYANGGKVSARRQAVLDSRAKRRAFLNSNAYYNANRRSFDLAQMDPLDADSSGGFRYDATQRKNFGSISEGSRLFSNFRERQSKNKIEQFRYTKPTKSKGIYYKGQPYQSGKTKFASGGLVGGEGGSGKGTGIVINPESLSSFNKSITTFVTSSDKLATSLDNFPREITLNANHKLEVILNGAQVLASLIPEVQKYIISETKSTLNNFIKDKLPDVGEIQ